MLTVDRNLAKILTLSEKQMLKNLPPAHQQTTCEQ